MKILVLSSAIPKSLREEVERTDRYPPVASDKYQWSLIQGIEAAAGKPVDLISYLPCSSYPHFKKIVIKGNRWRHETDADDIMISFCNLPVLRHVTQFLSFLWNVTLWIARHKSSGDWQVVSSDIYTPYLFAALIAARLFGGKPVLTVPDLPMGASKPRNIIKRIVKPLVNRLVLGSFSRHKGLIVLTRQIAEEYAPGEPYIVVEGFASPFENPEDRSSEIGEACSQTAKIVMFAGLLRREYGVQILLDAFELIHQDDYRLWIFGNGDEEMVAAVKAVALRDPRITYWGFQPNSVVLRKEQDSTILVNPRPSKQFTAYSFPSKVMEYMSVGKPVISAALPGIPAEYHEYMSVWQDETPEGLAKLLVSVCSRSPDELQRMGRKARDFVLREKDYLTQGRRIYEFLQQL